MVDWNERLIDRVLSSKFRASLVPAAAVIPAELEMGNIVAVKTYVVTFVLIAVHLNMRLNDSQFLCFVNSASKLERLT